MSPDDPNTSPTGATPRYNTFQIVDASKTIVSIVPNGVSMVSANQPFYPPVVKPTPGPASNLFEIDVYAGRQDTSPVADKFNSLSGGEGYVLCTQTNIGDVPGELNFFFGVTINLIQPSTGLTQSVTAYIGQGSDDMGDNNWWIGGSCISSSGALSAWFSNQLVSVGLYGSAANVFQIPNTGGPTIRSNVVTFQDNSKTIVGMSTVGIPMVTNGQPMNIPPVVTPNPLPASNNFLIEFDAGRSTSGPVAVAFNNACGGSNNEWGIGSVSDSSPGELNFYLTVDVTLQVGTNTNTVTVYLGQGDAGTGANNWWIGGSCISDSGQLTAVVGGQTVTLDMSSSGSSGFIFTAS